ncbi:MAG TPA: hypothetical protein VHP56_05525 [Solirubrobacterales bacterium]|nr:hypothetical protein [Solirubrobacterales bacterium]
MKVRAPIGLLALALVASGALLLSYASDLTFVGDAWEFLAGRPDWAAATFLHPFNEHPIMLLALAYKVLLALFGMDSAFPYYLVSISLFLFSAVLLFVFMRRRVGDWGALAGAVLILFMGAAYEDLLWDFQMCFFGSMAAGLGALLALDREDDFGDRVACLLLVVANASSSLGVPFIFAAVARVAMGPKPRWRRAYVALVPLALYAIWWLSTGHSAGNGIGPGDIPDLPRYVFDAAAAGIASLLGQQPIGSEGQPPLLAQILALLLTLVLIYRVHRERRLSPGLVAALVLVLSFWGLLAIDRGPQRFSSRFQYPSGVFLLIVAAEMLRGQRLPRWALPVLAVVVAAAVVGGISLLNQGSKVWRVTAENTKASLAAVEIAGTNADPQYRIAFEPSIYLTVEEYRSAEREHGTPAFSEAQLLTAEESQKQVADVTLAGATRLRLGPAMDSDNAVDCDQIRPVGDWYAEGRLGPAGTFEIDNRGREDAILTLGRFARTGTAQLGILQPGTSRSLHLPGDSSARAWRLNARGAAVRVCAID